MVIALLLLLLQEQGPSEPPRPAGESVELPEVHGTLNVRHRLRWTSDAGDQDLYEFLNVRTGDPDKDELAVILTLRVAEDLDGERDVSGAYVFDSREDTFRRSWNARLYALYAQFRPEAGVVIRAGRQTIDEIPEALPLDGIAMQAGLGAGWRAGLFGGKPVNLYESSTVEDGTAGGWLAVEPWTGGMARLEFLHLKDANQFGLFRNDLAALTMEQRWGAIRAWGRATMLEGEARDASLRLTASTPDLVVDAQAMFLFEQVQALSFGIDPFAVFLTPLEPYVQGTLRIAKPLGARFAVEMTAMARRLVRDGDEGEYNHEFTRVTLAPHATGWPVDSVSLSVSADWWDSPADRFWTIGGMASWRAHRNVTIAAGTSFALWTLDEFTGEERDRVRTAHVSVRWKASADLTFDLKTSFERSDDDTFTSLTIGVRRDF